MARRRRREYRGSDPNKAATIKTPVVREVQQLLSAYYQPVLSKFPAGPMTDSAFDRAGVDNAVALAMYDVAYNTSPAMGEFLDAASKMPAGMRKASFPSIDSGAYKLVQFALFMPSVPAQARIHGSCEAHLHAYPPELRRGHIYGVGSYSINCVPDGGMTGGWRQVSRTSHQMAHGDYTFARPVANVADERHLSEHASGSVRPQPYAVLRFVAPLAPPPGKVFMLPEVLSGTYAHNRQQTVQYSSDGLITPLGEYPHMDDMICIMPDHPDYAKWLQWGMLTYMADRQIQTYQKFVMWLIDSCSTVGQVVRMFPDLTNFITKQEVLNLLGDRKQRSPLPEHFTDRMTGENEDQFVLRMSKIRDVIRQLGGMCSRAVLMPQTTSSTFVTHLNTTSWAAGEPMRTMWNRDPV